MTTAAQKTGFSVKAYQGDAKTLRYLGISLGSNDNLYQTQQATAVGASVVQVVYNRLDMTPEQRVFPSCREQGLGVLAREPLASGFLTGKYKPGKTFTDRDDVRSRHDHAEAQAKLKMVQEIQQGEVPEGADMSSWALAWCLKHTAVTCVIPGCKTPGPSRNQC
jgi:aryl-alcohol dehydrogenase-like predicted oxidoreductase